MKRLLCLALIVLLSAVVGYAQEEAEVSATIVDAEGNELGTVSFMELNEDNARDMDIPAELLDGGMGVWVQLRGLTPGFHGFHVLSGVVINIIIWLNVVAGTYEKRGHYEMVEKVGLYWHFVDLVWVFVFTFYYLI